VGLLVLVASWGQFDYLHSAAAGQGQQALDYEFSVIGEELFTIVMVFVALVVAMVTPALTSGAITIEYEQQTFEFLLLTPLSESGILGGKLLSSMSFAGILVLCALPVGALAFIFGGVAIWQFIAVPICILLLALCFGAIGLYCSARSRKTPVATSLAYTFSFGLLFIQPIFEILGEGISETIRFVVAVLFMIAVFGLIIIGALACTSSLAKHDKEQRFRILKAPLTILVIIVILCTLLYPVDSGTKLYGNPVTSFLILLDIADNVPFFSPPYQSLSLADDWLMIPLSALILIAITLVALRKTHHFIHRQRTHPPKLPPVRFRMTPW
jgi:hypothetical protein